MGSVNLGPQSAINAINNNPAIKSMEDRTRNVSTTGVFEDFFNAAIGVLDKTSQHEIQSNQLQLDYITGKTDDMLSVVLAEQRAYTSLNFTVQVTNKIIDSYKQIMSMQL